MANNYVKFRRGNPEAFKLLLQENKAELDTLYFIYEEDAAIGELYLGPKLIAGGSSIEGARYLSALQDVLLSSKLNTNDCLVYDINANAWVNKPITDILPIFVGANGDGSSGVPGLVPAPTGDNPNLFLRSDGTWVDIVASSGAQVFQTIIGSNETHEQAINRIINELNAVPNVGDIAILQNLITEDNYQRISYVFNGEKWVAMDGNYSAETIYFSDDLLTTTSIGNIELVNGKAVIAAKGKNLKELFNDIFVKEKYPEAVEPFVTVKLVESGAYEVGSEISVNYTATLNPGSYTYGPETDIEVTNWTIQDNNGATTNNNIGSFEKVIVADNFNYFITAIATHNAGTIPVTNIGNSYSDAQIAAGTKTGMSNAITGYRNSFYGTMDNKPKELLSDDIRNLTGKSKKDLKDGDSFLISIPVGALRVLIAYPAHLRDLTSVFDKNDAESNIVSGFGSPTIVQVAGADEHEAIDYKVYKMDFAIPYDTPNIFTVVI